MADNLLSRFWLGRNNVEDFVLSDGPDSAVDSTLVSRVLLKLKNADDIDSAVLPDLFEWPVEKASGKWQGAKAIRLKLGDSALTPGRYKGEFITFDPDHPEGLVWLPLIHIEII